MGLRNASGVRRVKRGSGKPRLVIDFRYTDKTGARQRYRRDASVQTHAAASAEAARLMRQAAETGTVEVEPKAAGLTYSAFVAGPWAELYMPRFKPGTRRRYTELHAQRVLAAVGHLALTAIDAGVFRRLAADCARDGVQPRQLVILIRSVLKKAVETGHLVRFPDVPQGLTKQPKKLPGAPSWEEIQEMLRAPGWLGVAVALAAFAGLRLGEVQALEVRDVDFEHHLLLVRRSLSDDEVVATKSGDEAAIPLLPELEERLRAATRLKLPTARVVVNDYGRTPRRQLVLTRFKSFCSANGLPEWSFHSVRHHFVSELLRRGVGAEAARMLARHSDLGVTQRYAHATGDDLRAAVERLGRK